MKKYIFIVVFSTVLFFPSSYPILKLLLFVFFGICILSEIQFKNIYIGINMVLVYLILAVIGLLVTLISLALVGSHGGEVGIRLLFLSVIFYFSFAVFLVVDNKRFYWVIDAIYLSSLMVSVNAISYVSFNLVGLNYPLEFLDLDYRFGNSSSGLFAYSTNNLPLLMFTIPFMVSFNFLSKDVDKVKKIILTLSLICALISLRSAVILVSFLSFLIVFVVRRKFFLLLFLFFSSVVIVSVINVFFTEIIDTYLELKVNAFLSGDDQRFLQYIYWSDLISNSPFFGHGIGSSFASGGDIVNPYGYELTYMMLISEIGLIPIGIYFLLFAFVLVGLIIRFYRSRIKGFVFDSSVFFSIALGMFMFLLASMTNGYLMKLGFLWVIFIPITYLLSFKSERILIK